MTVTCVVPPPASITELDVVSSSSTVREYAFVLHPKFEKVAPGANTKAKYPHAGSLESQYISLAGGVPIIG